MNSEDTKISKINQYQKSDKAPFIFYAGLECFLEKIDGCKNNPENASTTKVGEHIPSDFSMPKILLYKSIENMLDVYKVKDWMKNFCELIYFKKKK